MATRKPKPRKRTTPQYSGGQTAKPRGKPSREHQEMPKRTAVTKPKKRRQRRPQVERTTWDGYTDPRLPG